MKLKYISGDYPTTMQGYLNNYVKEAFEEVFLCFKEKFNLTKEFSYQENPNHKFYLNFTAYVIYDPETKKIVDFAFEQFNDLVWILQIMNVGDIEFEIENSIAKSIELDLKTYKDRIVKI